MHLEAHAGFGWLIGQAARSRRVRGMALLAGILPDLDAVSYLWGPETYLAWHHVATHNVFAALLVAGVAFVVCAGNRLQAFGLTLASFFAHVASDAVFTQYPIHVFWPLANGSFLFPGAVWLGHPINTALVYIAMALTVLVGFIWKRTPVEFFSPELDDRIVNLFFRRKRERCAVCKRHSNEHCIGCGKPLCLRHGRLGFRFTVLCEECGREKKGDSE